MLFFFNLLVILLWNNVDKIKQENKCISLRNLEFESSFIELAACSGCILIFSLYFAYHDKYIVPLCVNISFRIKKKIKLIKLSMINFLKHKGNWCI